MTNEIERFIQEHGPRGLLIDTNLLLLLALGSFSRDRISQFKRTASYTTADYDLLALFVGQFEKIITTPNVLSEFSNLAGQMADPMKSNLFEFLRDGFFVLVDETYVKSHEASRHDLFLPLGITDAAIGVLARDRTAILTDDLRLYVRLAGKEGVDVINFNHIRDLLLG